VGGGSRSDAQAYPRHAPGLVDAGELLPGQDFQFFLRQRGMFSYTGFSVEQVRRLRDEFGVYLIDSGRVCMSGLRPANLRQVAEAFAAVHKG
jgi:aromatic-amino-acid transaminase